VAPLKRKKVRVVAMSKKPLHEPKQRLAVTIALLIVVLLVFSATVYYLLSGGNNGGEKEEELVARIDPSPIVNLTAGVAEAHVWIKEEFTLSAHNSTGPIDEYVWDMNADVDTDHDGNPRNDRDKTGVEITYRYERAGVYTIVLWVFDSRGNFDKAQGKVHVSYHYENISGQTTGTGDKWTHDFLVPSDTETATSVKAIEVTFVYPASTLPPNQLNLTIYDGADNPVINGTYQERNEDGNVVVDWYISAQWLAVYDAGTWTVEVTQLSPPLAPVSFTLSVYVLY